MKNSRIIRGYEYRAEPVSSNLNGAWHIVRQPINSKTGKAWQAKRRIQYFSGERAKAKALWALTKLK